LITKRWGSATHVIEGVVSLKKDAVEVDLDVGAKVRVCIGLAGARLRKVITA